MGAGGGKLGLEDGSRSRKKTNGVEKTEMYFTPFRYNDQITFHQSRISILFIFMRLESVAWQAKGRFMKILTVSALKVAVVIQI